MRISKNELLLLGGIDNESNTLNDVSGNFCICSQETSVSFPLIGKFRFKNGDIKKKMNNIF